MSKNRLYKLVGKTPVPMEPNDDYRACWDARRLAITEVCTGVIVSTVFLGIEINGDWFESVVYISIPGSPGVFHGPERRYVTYDEAVTGHNKMCSDIGDKYGSAVALLRKLGL